ncbi:glycosyltransferase [Prochlorococcus marinus]|uniref:glycosyltransferase n=1 Tax=Prochlorococcus marinus TaxID=1219 RepID=UPI0022B54387|nr:glycosyltransferase [Prochlorococcus marinus]
MKIVIDLQGLQIDGNRKRGIGRYCLEITKALIKYYPKNEYILFTNSNLFDLRNDFIDELNNKNYNLTYFQCPTVGDLNESYSGKYSSFWLSTQLRSYALSLINADIILITSFFDGFRNNTLVSHDKSFQLPPIVSIIYDLIPLIHSDQYLNNDQEFKLFYLKKIEELSNLDGLLAISQSSLREANQYLDIKSDLIFNISAACNDNKFTPVVSNLNVDTAYLGKFLLYCGATDPRKNLSRLIEAYASLPVQLIFKHKLVLTGPYTDEEKSLIQEWMINFGLPPEYVVFLGFITDIELANLYRTCYLLIFPSLHEGFGLPVLEAMHCGAPVIASNLTSLPELLGDQRFLFDPYNVKEISYLIQKSLTDNIFYQSICSNSKERRKNYSWKKTSIKTIKSLKQVIDSKSSLSDKNKSNFNYLIKNQYHILLENLGESPLVKHRNKLQIRYLKSLASAISIINNQSKKIELLRRSKITDQFTWKIEGPFDSSYSLAILNKNFALAMENLGQNVELFCTEGLGDYQPDQDFLEKNQMINKLYQKSIESKNSIFICSRNLYPPRVNDAKGVINLLHSYGWEESEFPSQWVNDFNANLQGMTVMSEQVKKILIDNGVQLPIKVSGLGLDHFKNIKSTIDFKVKAKKFKILHISSCFPRKGVDILIKAYANSFSDSDDVSLIVKTFDNPHNKIDSILEQARQTYSNFPDVILIKDDLNDSQIKSLYKQSDLLVAPSRGEGFGLPIAEAMLIGVPVITTNWGGQLDFCNSKNSWLVDYQFVQSKSHFRLDFSCWAEPSCLHLGELIKEVYILPKEEVRKKTIAARSAVEKMTWNNVALKNKQFVEDQFITKIDPSIRLGFISTFNSRCGIASYTKHLLEFLPGKIFLFTPLSESSNNNIKNDYEIIPSWNIDSKVDDFSLLIDNIKSLNITSIIIQFNFSFFDFDRFHNLINLLSQARINTIIIMHSTIAPVNNESKKVSKLINSLKKCDRILVHTIDDLNRLKGQGLIDNVSLFPHGILDFSPNQNNSSPLKRSFRLKNKIRIASYGFCLPNKGFKQLILAINILRKKNINIYLDIYSAIYSEDYLYVYEELVSLVNELNLAKYIFINNKFMSDIETLNILSKYQSVVFPYQESQESSSASVRHGLASNRPVLVTPSSIFNDVLDLVDVCQGFNPEDIAEGIIKYVIEKKSFNKKRSILENERLKKISNRKFSLLARRLYSMIKSLEINI